VHPTRSRGSLLPLLAMLLAVGAGLALPSRPALAASPVVTLSRSVGPPTLVVTAAGTGFGLNEGVDVYFDRTDLVLTVTDGAGAFSVQIQIPPSATPGTHWVTAIGRSSGLAAQKSYLVRTNWPSFRSTPQHAGRNRYENVLGPWNLGDLEELWAARTGGFILGGACVYNGLAYVGSFDGKLYAFNAASGALSWSKSLGGQIVTTPAIAGNRIYAGSTNGTIAAYSLTGGAVWSRVLPDQARGPLTATSSLLYVPCYDHRVYALNLATGATVWSYLTADQVFAAPAVAGGVAYVATLGGTVYALDAATGAYLWSYATGAYLESTPAVLNGRLFFGTGDNHVYALSASNGSLLWRADLPASVLSSPAASDNTVYVGVYDGSVRALDARTGAEKWTTITTAATGIEGAPTVANGVVWIASNDGNLYALEKWGGSIVWSARVGAVYYGDPVVADGMVYIGSSDNRLHAFGFPPAASVAPVVGAMSASGAGPGAVSGRPSPGSLRPDRSLRPGAPQRGLVEPADEDEP
jgi:outer membrane protein assembly factor BamB